VLATPIGDGTAARIAESARATSLESLDVHNGSMTLNGLEAVACSIGHHNSDLVSAT
jgi:hypothetical protein